MRPYLTKERGLVKVQIRARTPKGLVNVNMGRYEPKMANHVACYADTLRRYVADGRELARLKMFRTAIKRGTAVQLAFITSI